jgi:Xaa-Pro aminopeptidase
VLEDMMASIGSLRLIKDELEKELMRKSARITAETHKELMAKVKPGINEREVEYLLEYGFKSRGAKRVSYGSIVAGGKNATCLHYHENNESLRDGDLLLIDAAGEFEMYSSDITRTFPVGKKFSKEQAAIYDIVLESQKSGIEFARPGVTMQALHDHCTGILIEGLLRLGFLKGTREEILRDKSFRRFYPHSTGHWIGLDTHDVGLYMDGAESRKLEPGMVITIEPGIYIQPNDLEVPAEYRGIGIRIEDDILITENGRENLTAFVPKERNEIEALRA